MSLLFIRNTKPYTAFMRFCTTKKCENLNTPDKFETIFSFPYVRYFALLNRLKVYHIFGTSIAVPACGLMEVSNLIPEYTFLTAAYIGLTGAAVLSVATLPLRNIIGHLYISEDNKLIKISALDYWGKRKDKIVAADDWIPLNDMKSSFMDSIYLIPQLTDGTKYKLFVKYGQVYNSQKIGAVLE